LGQEEIFSMKNLIDPQLLADLNKENVTVQEAVKFLDSNPTVTVSNLANIINMDAKKIYNHRYYKATKNSNKEVVSESKVLPKAASKSQQRYSPEEKYLLVNEYLKAGDDNKTELLRRYGLYQADISHWEVQIKQAALEALGKRKARSDKKSDEQKKIEKLEKELAAQEKTTAKLSTLLVLQKKLSIC